MATETRATPDAITAMDRLNSFVRTKRSPMYPELYRHVYAMKRMVIAAADEVGLVVSRPIYVEAKCRNCNGTGIYNARWDTRCRTCDGTGTQRLHFHETRIGRTLIQPDWTLADVVWHTPTPRRYAENAEPVTGWKPNTPGKMIEPNDVALCLLWAEKAWGNYSFAEVRYGFWLGDTGDSCALCGSHTGPMVHMLVTRGRLRWSSCACDGCWGHFKVLHGAGHAGDGIMRAMPFPEGFVTPAIAEWMNRHGGRKELMRSMMDPDW